MKDYRELFGYAAILFGIGFVFRSVDVAYASPTGPNTSLGQNPSFSFYSKNCTSDETVVTVDTDKILIITDIISSIYDSDDVIILKTNSEELAQVRVDSYTTFYSGGTTHVPHYKLESGIVIPSGETLLLNCSSNAVTITGYYAHP